jgi:hypothetical protein
MQAFKGFSSAAFSHQQSIFTMSDGSDDEGTEPTDVRMFIQAFHDEPRMKSVPDNSFQRIPFFWRVGVWQPVTHQT